MDVRVFPGKSQEIVGEQRNGGWRHADVECRRLTGFYDFAPGEIRKHQKRSCLFIQCFSCLGQSDFLRAADEKRNLKLFLQHFDLIT